MSEEYSIPTENAGIEIRSEKALREREVNCAISGLDGEYVLWGEDLYDTKIRVFPGKISEIPEYEEIKNQLENAILIYFDYSKENYIKLLLVKVNAESQTTYISEGSFNAVWIHLRRSIALGVRLQKEKSNEIPINKAEDILDLSLLERNGSIPIIRKGKLVYEAKKISEEIIKKQSRKQSVLDNQNNRYFYNDNENIFHDRDCELVKDIPAEEFMGSKILPNGKKPCIRCRRRMFLREACSPYVKMIPVIDKMLYDQGIKDYHLEWFVFHSKLKFRIDKPKELTVQSKEDTWIIKGFDGEELSLWHNNYVMTSPRERYITQGFHNQGYDGMRLSIMLKVISAYRFNRHLDAEDVDETEIPDELSEEEPEIKTDDNLAHKFELFLDKLFKIS